MECIKERLLLIAGSGSSKPLSNIGYLHSKVIDFLENVNTCLDIKPIAGDGSDRRFFRVQWEGQSFVVMYSPPDTPFRARENRAFDYFSNHLASNGIPVPKVYTSDQMKGIFLMEDLGDISLYNYIHHHPKARQLVYRKAIALLVHFQKKATFGINPDVCVDGSFYDPPFVLEKELEYFRRSFLCNFLGLSASWNSLKDDFCRLADLAGTSDSSSCIHRDFQSRNIMIKRGKLHVIDYQAMRYGPGEYDLAALLIDPYVGIPSHERWGLAKFYARLNKDFSFERYEVVSLCRNLQILAAFAFLGKEKGKSFFLRFIPKALKELSSNRHILVRLGFSSLCSWLNKAREKFLQFNSLCKKN
ncbi:MAG: phosphotransferase [Thermodesulforhabdaceae bacterium]